MSLVVITKLPASDWSGSRDLRPPIGWWQFIVWSGPAATQVPGEQHLAVFRRVTLAAHLLFIEFVGH